MRMATRPEVEFQRLTCGDGNTILHHLGDRGDQGTFYVTTLISKAGPYDAMVTISREPGVDEGSLPIDQRTAGIWLIQRLME